MEPREESPPVDLRAKAKAFRAPLKILDPVRVASTPFTDHNGQKGVFAYTGKAPSLGGPMLPPLWSFQFYITFGALADSDPSLPEKLLWACRRSMVEGYPLRLDVNFLPGADPERCMEHYRAEKVARQEAGAPLPVTNPYGQSFGTLSFLVLIEHADWESKGATTVSFDFSDEESGEPYIKRDIMWGDYSPPPFEQYLGQVLHSLTYATPGRDESNDLYDARLEQGRSDWS
jgi:hypothetical protein